MASIKLSSSETPKIIHLIEQMFPGSDLSAITKASTGITADGTITITKTLSATESVALSLTITKD